MKKSSPKKISFNGILNSEYFFHRSGPLKLALNKNRLLNQNFFLDKAKNKFSLKKNKRVGTDESNTSQEYKRDKTKIPGELYKVILKYGAKFLNQNEQFFSCKKENDDFLSYWHFINDRSKKKERKLILEKYFNEEKKNGINLNSNLIKTMTQNLFKESPLLSGNKFSEIFFHYLSEFDKNYQNKDKMIYIKQKVKNFLEKLRDFLKFVEVQQDSGMDSITKDIKLKNSKYQQEYLKKVRIENIKMLKKRRKENIKNNKISKKIIKKTGETLTSLEKNKYFLDEDIPPSDINSKLEMYRNFLSPDKTSYSTQSKFHIFTPNLTSKMNSTSSTAFQLSGPGFFTKKNNKKIFSGLNYQINNNLDDSNIKSATQINKLIFHKLNPINSNLTTRKNLSLSKFGKLNIKDKIINLTPSKELDTSSRKNPIKKNKYTSIKESSSYLMDEKIKLKDLIKRKTIINNKNNNFSGNKKEKSKKNNNDLKNMKKLLNKSKSQLSVLYEISKNRSNFDYNGNDELKDYFVKRGKVDESLNSLKKVHSMDIIKKAQLITDKIDIEQRTKKIFQSYLTFEKIKKLEGIRSINNDVRHLDKNFINNIIKYQSSKIN